MSELPPLDQPQAYVVVGPQDQRGPYTMDLLIAEVVAGRLSDATPVWWPGLADWTTMAAHPGVAAETARRRAAEAPAEPAPAWAAEPEPQPSPSPFAEPAAEAPEPVAEPAAEAPEPVAEPAAEAPEPVAEPAPTEFTSDVAASDVVEAEVVEPEEAHLATFREFVRRSAGRAEIQAVVDAADAQIVEAVTEGVRSSGFEPAEQVDLDDRHELRFDDGVGDLVVASVGKPTASTPDDLRLAHVPLTLSYRAARGGSDVQEVTGEHGEVVVTADEWTGQSTSTVRLFLGLDHYLGDGEQIRGEDLAGDIAAAVAVLRSRLG